MKLRRLGAGTANTVECHVHFPRCGRGRLVMEMTCENVSNAPVVAPHVHRSEIEELTRVIVDGLPRFAA